MTDANEWKINTGTVPEGVGVDTVIEVEYRCGYVMLWHSNIKKPELWTLEDFELDVIRWRFVGHQ